MSDRMSAVNRPAVFGAARTAPGLSGGNSQSWLREVERARWAAQPRHERGAEGAASFDVPGVHDVHAGAPVAAAVGVQAFMPGVAIRGEDSVAGQQGAGSGSPAAQGSAIGERTGDWPASGLAAPLVSATAVALATPVRRAGPADALLRVSQVLRDARSTDDPAAFQMHVELSETHVSVWLRDAQVGTQDALALMERLSRTLSSDAQLAGRALRFTVNGQPVLRGDTNSQQEHVVHQQREGERHGG